MRLRRGAAVLLVVFGIGVSGGAGVDAAPENRLAGEKSPYLQLHAADPVDWYPWGPEALGKARREGKPIFLSIGYSTCHWCHVMHEESFSDAGIAALLNRSFVAIKVDREERPDLDRIYMAYLVSVSGGGWPMTLFLTPELVPFFGATYLPPDDHNGEPGLRTLVRGLAGLWTDDRDEALEVAQENMRLLERRAQALGGAATSADQGALHETWARLRASYDARFGGFGGAPKFPRPVALNFLLRYHARTDEPLAAELAAGTLHGMARGGIRDHLAGGFHRYATDSAWRVPHFEKMLYDQALIAAAYTEAHLVTGDADLGAVARETLDFVLRDMRGPSGAFISALDADSPAPAGRPGTEAGRSREGAYYVWTAREIEAVLGADAPAFAFHHGVEPGGNVPASLDERGELAGTNVLAIRHTLADTASRFKTTEARMAARLDAARRRLAAAR
ncbi:MAG: thioredoxin domain-containing protein, partial [Acidimicrobiia bacterium]|nr:thioredoxin domain-containing protein [Acidimicrobiia bacterium]